MGLSVRVHHVKPNTNTDKLLADYDQQSLSPANKCEQHGLKTSPLKKSLCWKDTPPWMTLLGKSCIWQGRLSVHLDSWRLSLSQRLRHFAVRLHPHWVNLLLNGDWLKPKGPSFSQAPPPPASVYPSPNKGWILAIKQHFQRNPWHWSNGITVGWFNPWIVNRISPLTRKILLHRITRIT